MLLSLSSSEWFVHVENVTHLDFAILTPVMDIQLQKKLLYFEKQK